MGKAITKDQAIDEIVDHLLNSIDMNAALDMLREYVTTELEGKTSKEVEQEYNFELGNFDTDNEEDLVEVLEENNSTKILYG